MYRAWNRNAKIYDSCCVVRGRSYYFTTTFWGISCPKLLLFAFPVHFRYYLLRLYYSRYFSLITVVKLNHRNDVWSFSKQVTFFGGCLNCIIFYVRCSTGGTIRPTRGTGARATPIRPLTLNLMATYPKIPHGNSTPNLGAQRTPIRPLLRKIQE